MNRERPFDQQQDRWMEKLDAWPSPHPASLAVVIALALLSIQLADDGKGHHRPLAVVSLLLASLIALGSLIFALRRSAPLGKTASYRTVAYVAAAGVLASVLARAWVGDDAAITMRSLDNLMHGYGWRWNVAERVQVFTHPLWAMTLLLPLALNVGWYGSLLLLSLLATAACLFCVLRRARSFPAAISVIGVLALSRSFLDFSTSGLENSLTNLLLALFVFATPAKAASSRDLLRMSLVAGLLSLNRLDTIVITLPALAWVAASAGRSGVPLPSLAMRAAAGFSPLFLWLAFSIVYYGFPFPNTAYAKLGTAIGLATSLQLGAEYVRFALERDSWTLVAAVVAALCVVRWRASSAALALGGGALAYYAYVVGSGGDFMGGRQFVAPLVVAATLLGSHHLEFPPHGDRVMPVALILLGVTTLWWPLILPRASEGPVVDERAKYVRGTGLLAVLRANGVDHPWFRRGARVRRQAAEYRAAHGDEKFVLHAYTVGMLGLAAGPDVHIVDHLALTDPLLARLPAGFDPEPRPGHFERMGQWSSPVPVTKKCPQQHEVCRFWEEYKHSLRTGDCQLRDANLCAYWRELRIVTEGELFSRARWLAILRLNTGVLDGLIDRDRYRDATREYPGMAQEPAR